LVIYKKIELASKVINALNEAGWNAFFINHTNPYKIHAYLGEETLNLKIIIYNITHGGRTRMEDEYRIQIKEKLIEENNFITLLLGYYDSLNLFVGFDINKHRYAAYSASSQIKKDILDKAYLTGFAIYKNKLGESVIAFKPEFIIEYIINLKKLHGFSTSIKDIHKFNEIIETSHDINEELIDEISEPRRETVYSVTKKIRSSTFSYKVLSAYNYSCAFCNLQMKLIEAAHILPIGIEGSVDETYNGISLCVLHHRAYDKALIMFDEKYDIKYNKEKFEELKEIGHDRGIDKFIKNLREKILLPYDIKSRPHVKFIRQANSYRNWK
jgi:putative restriction endonuclease